MTGAVCDELVLVTRSDRAVVVWEYGGGSRLYFLEGDLVSRVFEEPSPVEFGINRPDSGPNHCHRAAQASDHDWGQRRPRPCEEYPDLCNCNRSSRQWRPKAEKQKYSGDSRDHGCGAQSQSCGSREMCDPATEQKHSCQYALKKKTGARPAFGECGKETLHTWPFISRLMLFGVR